MRDINILTFVAYKFTVIFFDKRIYLIQIKHLLKMLVPSEVYHQKMKIEMTEYIRAKGDNS